LKELREYARDRILPLASSTHRVEAMVRECSHVSATNRGEASRSNYIFLRSIYNTWINREATKTREGRELKGNGSMGGGKKGERQVRGKNRNRHQGEVEKKNLKYETVRGKVRAKIMCDLVLSRYNAVAGKNHNDRKAIKRRRSLGSVKYADLKKKDHTEFLKEQLRLRVLQFNDTENGFEWKSNLEMLKEYEFNTVCFEPIRYQNSITLT